MLILNCHINLMTSLLEFQYYFDEPWKFIHKEDVVKKSLVDNFNQKSVWIYTDKLLSCLLEYDKNKDIHVLSLAEDISNISLKDCKNKDKNIINSFQIKKRLNTLDDNDMRRLFDLKNSSESLLVKCCACILIGHSEEISYMLSKLPQEDLDNLKEWPIYNLYQP